MNRLIHAPDFFLRTDVLEIARDLIGTRIAVNRAGIIRKGIIVETEAYNGVVDRASHSYRNRITARNQTMYLEGGHAYVYLCYGIHNLFNVVTSVAGDPKAVLIRAISTEDDQSNHYPGSGPGKLCRYLGIDRQLDGHPLVGSAICLEPRDPFMKIPLGCGGRIGVEYAGDDAHLPYRFVWMGHPALSGSRSINRKMVPFPKSTNT